MSERDERNREPAKAAKPVELPPPSEKPPYRVTLGAPPPKRTG